MKGLLDEQEFKEYQDMLPLKARVESLREDEKDLESFIDQKHKILEKMDEELKIRAINIANLRDAENSDYNVVILEGRSLKDTKLRCASINELKIIASKFVSQDTEFRNTIIHAELRKMSLWEVILLKLNLK